MIDTAERLFGRLGIDGVSLREIAAAAGQSNSNVVQYHFKDKNGLINAILVDRVTRMEPIRRERLRALRTGRPRPRELFKVLWAPMLDIVDADGVHMFCRFMLQVMMQTHVALDSDRGLYTHSLQTDGRALIPNVLEAIRRLRAHYPHLPERTANRRLWALSMMFLASVVEYDNAQVSRKTRSRAVFDMESIIDMAVASMRARSGARRTARAA